MDDNKRRLVRHVMELMQDWQAEDALISGLAAKKDMNREVDQDVHERSAV